ncbi:MAG: ATP-dependent helicase, partial [Clostridiales bacterium]|nr:ATP-dependent helicase [Clostridiales bacterium]
MTKSLQKLNKEQIEAIKHFIGPCLVIAGPGTGKTTVITHRVFHLIKNHKVNPRDILVVTFTRAAAKEMEDRFRKLSYCQKEYKGVTFGTFHSVYFRILRTYKNYKLDDFLNEKERYQIIKLIIKKLGYDFYEDDQIVDYINNEISYMNNTLTDSDKFISSSIDDKIFKKIRKEYENYKCLNDKYDYDDMLIHCYKLLIDDYQILEEVREKYKYILIDEFQDINKVQFEIMKNIAYPRNNIFVVGDDDQSIYGFRGADSSIMFKFLEDYKTAKTITLIFNYRSSKAIINSAMSLINNNKKRYEKKLMSVQDMGYNPYIIRVEDFEEEAKVISEKIKNRIKEGGRYSEFAVIYRTNIQSRAFIDTFSIANIPYVAYDGTESIYNHWVIKDILSYLKAATGFDRNNNLLRIINKPNRYISRYAIEEALKRQGDLLDNIVLSNSLNDLQVRAIYQLKNCLPRIKSMTTSEAVKFIRHFVGYEEYVRDYAHAKSIDFKFFKELIEEISSSAKGFPIIQDYIIHVEKTVGTGGSKLKDNKNIDAVSLITMHKAKGLEFEQVFISGAVDGIIPYIKEDDLELDVLEDERRLFYVAMTRAKKALYIIVPKYRYSRKVIPTRYIDEIDGWLKDYRDNFRCGDKISHKYFGEGIIKEVYNNKGDYIIIVEF